MKIAEILDALGIHEERRYRSPLSNAAQLGRFIQAGGMPVVKDPVEAKRDQQAKEEVGQSLMPRTHPEIPRPNPLPWLLQQIDL